MERVTDNVYATTDARGCNPGYVVTSKGVVMIDTPQLPTKAVAMREEIAKKGPLRYLINTEYHMDHVFGNFFFAGLATGIAHEHILKDFWAPVRGMDVHSYVTEIVKKDDPQGLALLPKKEALKVDPPAITFSSRLTLRLGDHVFDLYHTPGHTKGQIAVHIPKERVIFSADTIFCECQTWFHSADPESWLRSLEFLRTLEADHIVPGHGPVCTKDYILKQSAFIREWMAAVAAGLAKGWSKEECVQRISFLDRFPMDVGQADLGPQVQRMNVERLYDFLLGKTERYS
jgi:glyoxylase-like metal-dependent hydrolase (beta-lactamase superfamily II)